jgi:hypothetical protein
VVDGGGLENRCTRKGTGGSNPSPSEPRPRFQARFARRRGVAAKVGRQNTRMGHADRMRRSCEGGPPERPIYAVVLAGSLTETSSVAATSTAGAEWNLPNSHARTGSSVMTLPPA